MCASGMDASSETDEMDWLAEEAAERAAMLRSAIRFQRYYRKKAYTAGRRVGSGACNPDDIEAA